MNKPADPWTLAVRRGDYEAAWSLQAQVLAARDPATRDDPRLPYHLRWVWDGRPLAGAHVLVRCYHGLGDTLQFARYLPRLREVAASVALEIQPHLLPLFSGFPGVDRLIPFDPARPTPASGCDIEIMELAFALRLPPSAAPPPYIHVAPALLPKGTIGLCWQAGDWDGERSLEGQHLAALTKRPCITLVTGACGLEVLNPGGCPQDMMVTAALVAGTELVVTVDTMIAHLAGAMGKQACLLAKHDPDWRWPLDADRSDWYPSIRIYRQPSPGDWAGAITRLERDILSADTLRARSTGT